MPEAAQLLAKWDEDTSLDGVENAWAQCMAQVGQSSIAFGGGSDYIAGKAATLSLSGTATQANWAAEGGGVHDRHRRSGMPHECWLELVLHEHGAAGLASVRRSSPA